MSERRLCVYVAGPFRAYNAHGKIDAWHVHQNVIAAMSLALEVWRRGCVAICPHSNTMFFQDADGIDDLIWLDGDMELLRRCDAMLLTPNWDQSVGARKERSYAWEVGIPVLKDLAALDEWIATQPARLPYFLTRVVG